MKKIIGFALVACFLAAPLSASAQQTKWVIADFYAATFPYPNIADLLALSYSLEAGNGKLPADFVLPSERGVAGLNSK